MCLLCVPRIDNPKYKGIWVAPDIDNPDFKDDPKLYVQKDIKYIGFELWQVGGCKGGGSPGGVRCLGPCLLGCWEEAPSKRHTRVCRLRTRSGGWTQQGCVCCCSQSLVACWCVRQQARALTLVCVSVCRLAAAGQGWLHL